MTPTPRYAVFCTVAYKPTGKRPGRPRKDGKPQRRHPKPKPPSESRLGKDRAYYAVKAITGLGCNVNAPVAERRLADLAQQRIIDVLLCKTPDHRRDYAVLAAARMLREEICVPKSRAPLVVTGPNGGGITIEVRREPSLAELDAIEAQRLLLAAGPKIVAAAEDLYDVGPVIRRADTSPNRSIGRELSPSPVAPVDPPSDPPLLPPPPTPEEP